VPSAARLLHVPPGGDAGVVLGETGVPADEIARVLAAGPCHVVMPGSWRGREVAGVHITMLRGARIMMSGAPGALARVADPLVDAALGARARACRPAALRLRGGTLEWPGRPLVMGIVNVTPDSFYDGGRHATTDAAVAHGEALVAGGAELLDVGGESTRPGAAPVPADVERARVVPVVAALARRAGVPVSVDTRRAQVAAAALEAGAALVNDVSGLRFDPELARVVARAGAALCVMHSVKTPADMMQDVRYDDLAGEVFDALGAACARAREAGVAGDALLVDPGIGFGKRAKHNLALLSRLPELHALGYWVLVGPSRKRFIGDLTGRPPEGRLYGTAAAVAIAAAGGAHVVRVHDVEEMRDVVRVAGAIAAGGLG
jgi:dihydropteroate synthase